MHGVLEGHSLPPLNVRSPLNFRSPLSKKLVCSPLIFTSGMTEKNSMLYVLISHVTFKLLWKSLGDINNETLFVFKYVLA